MLGLKETINHLAMAYSVRRHGRVTSREVGHIMRRALEFEVDGQKKGS